MVNNYGEFLRDIVGLDKMSGGIPHSVPVFVTDKDGNRHHIKSVGVCGVKDELYFHLKID